MGLGIPKSIVICAVLSFLYGYGSNSFLKGGTFLIVSILFILIWKWLTNK